MLNNRVYRGEAVQKGKAYPGEDDAIIDERLGSGHGRRQAVIAKADYPQFGLAPLNASEQAVFGQRGGLFS